MTTDSQFNDLHQNLADGMVKHTNESTGAMDDMVKRDRFELLSAYLDGEVTAAERKQVEEWLANDPAVKCLYARLISLRQGLRAMPVPASERPIEQTVQQVMARLRRRSQIKWAFGGAAVAACILGSLVGIIPGGEVRMELAQQRIESAQKTPEEVGVTGSPLMLTLNHSIVPIPKAPVASPEKPVPQGQDIN
jgi:predicted anti-sigma-YlaC factor YlaD